MTRARFSALWVALALFPAIAGAQTITTPAPDLSPYAKTTDVAAAIAPLETSAHAAATYSTPASVATAISAIPPYTAGAGISIASRVVTNSAPYSAAQAITDLAGTYATISSLSGYVQTSTLASYATTASLSAYLTTSAASSTYLTQSAAAATYSTPASVATALGPYETTAAHNASLPAAFAIGAPTVRTLTAATAYQATTTTKPAVVTINLSGTATISLSGGATNTAAVYLGSTNAVAGGTGTLICPFTNGNTGALTLGLNLSTTATATCTFALPAGWYFSVRILAGTVTVVSAFDQTAG